MRKSLRNTILPLLGLTFVAGLFDACQSTGSPDPEPKGSMTAIASFTITSRDSSRLPDSIHWAAGKQSGKGRFACVNFSCTDTLALSDALGQDTAHLLLYNLGLHIATYNYSQSGRTPNLTQLPSSSRNDVSLAVLSSFFELRKSKVDSFTKLGASTPGQVVDYYAWMVYSKSAGYVRFPDSLPLGMNADSVRTDLVRLAAEAKSSWVTLAATKWGLDSTSIHAITIRLLGAGLLVSADTLSLFPPPPVRVLQPIFLAKPVTRGGPPVGIGGLFSWDKGSTPSPTFEIRTRSGVDSSHFHFPTLRYLPTDTSWMLAGNLTLQVDREATPGIDTLVITLTDGKGNKAISKLVFEVASGDTTAPSVRFESPSKDSLRVENTTELYRLVAVASDSSGIDSIRIGNKTSTGARCTSLVELALGSNTFTARAWDGYKNTDSTTVTIVRQKTAHSDSTKPTIERLVPRSNDSVVDWTTLTMAMSWKVSDDSGVAKVSLDDSILSAGSDGAYRKSVPLVVGRNTFVLTAFDARGNVRRDTARIVRKADTTKPVVALVTPPRDTSVGNATGTMLVKVSASDAESGIDSVKIGTNVVKAAPFEASIDLSTGDNTVSIQAWDKAGNASTTTSVKITRAALGDTIKPDVSLVSPARDTSVGNATSSVLVKIAATDSGSGIDSVKIGSKVVKAAPYEANIDLAVGDNSVSIQAWDKAGNASATIFVKITRAALGDTTRPTVVRSSPKASDTTVDWGTTSMTFLWTVTDDSSLAKVLFEDSTLTGVDGVYQIAIGLPVGAKTYTLTALDARGNIRKDTVRVVRLADVSKPVAARGATTRDTVLPASAASLAVSWSVTDNALQSVTIEGTAVTATAGSYSRTVPLVGTDMYIHLVALDVSGNRTTDSVRIRRLGAPTLSPKTGLLSGSQTVSLLASGTLAGAIVEISSNKTTWTEYSAAILVSKSQIVYARSKLGFVVSAIDSAVFLYEPTFTPAGGAISAPISVVIAAPGAVVEDSLSSGTTWSTYTTPITLSGSAKVYARSKLGGLQSAKVVAEYAFAPVVSPATIRDTGKASVSVAVSATGVDSIETSLNGTTWTRLTTASVTMINSGTLYARSRVGASISPVATASVHLYPSPPILLPVPGSYASAQDIEFKSTTSAVTIQYSLDGTTWSAYSAASLPTIAATGTIRARCFRSGWDTVVVQGSYKISDINWNTNGTLLTYGKLRDTRDGQTYRTTTITVGTGTQTWMAENLNYKVDSSWCYGDKTDSCGKYGRLYQWTAAMGVGPEYLEQRIPTQTEAAKGVCPFGYHLPLFTETRALQQAYSDGHALKSTAGWPTGETGVNWTGFTMVPGGLRLSNGNFMYAGNVGFWWVGTERDETDAPYFQEIKDPDTEYWDNKTDAYSIRCLAD